MCFVAAEVTRHDNLIYTIIATNKLTKKKNKHGEHFTEFEKFWNKDIVPYRACTVRTLSPVPCVLLILGNLRGSSRNPDWTSVLLIRTRAHRITLTIRCMQFLSHNDHVSLISGSSADRSAPLPFPCRLEQCLQSEKKLRIQLEDNVISWD